MGRRASARRRGHLHLAHPAEGVALGVAGVLVTATLVAALGGGGHDHEPSTPVAQASPGSPLTTASTTPQADRVDVVTVPPFSDPDLRLQVGRYVRTPITIPTHRAALPAATGAAGTPGTAPPPAPPGPRPSGPGTSGTVSSTGGPRSGTVPTGTSTPPPGHPGARPPASPDGLAGTPAPSSSQPSPTTTPDVPQDPTSSASDPTDAVTSGAGDPTRTDDEPSGGTAGGTAGAPTSPASDGVRSAAEAGTTTSGDPGSSTS